MQVIITLGGLGKRFKDLGHTNPKPFVSVANKPVIAHLVDSLVKNLTNDSKKRNWKLFFVINEQLHDFKAQEKLEAFYPESKVITSAYSKRGPIDTVLAALPSINFYEPVFVTYCDYAMIWNPVDFESFVTQNNSDAAIIGYRGFHPTYFGPNSYAHMQAYGDFKNNFNNDFKDTFTISRIQEKVLFTDSLENEYTSCGAYWFKSGKFLKDCLEEQFRQNLNYKGEFYVSLAIQAMINASLLRNEKIKIHYFPISHFVQLGTPFDTERYEFWYFVLVQKGHPENFVFKFIEEKFSPVSFSKEIYEQEKKYWEVILLQ